MLVCWCFRQSGSVSTEQHWGTAFSFLLLLVAVLIACSGLANVDRSLCAVRAEGALGTFTGTTLDCVQHLAHWSCTCHGTYTPGRWF